MRVASFVAGLLGGLLGLAVQVKLVVDGWPGRLPAGGSGLITIVVMLGLAALVIGAGLAGAVLSLSRPRTGALLMMVSGVIGLPLVPGYFLAGPPLIVGSFLAHVDSFRPTRKMTDERWPSWLDRSVDRS